MVLFEATPSTEGCCSRLPTMACVPSAVLMAQACNMVSWVRWHGKQRLALSSLQGARLLTSAIQACRRLTLPGHKVRQTSTWSATDWRFHGSSLAYQDD